MIREVLDKDLSRGFHIYATVVECIVIDANQVKVELQFDRKALPEGSARFIIEQFEHVVHQLVSLPPSSTLSDVSMITPAHYQQMVGARCTGNSRQMGSQQMGN